MSSPNSQFDPTSRALEIEVIKRFRDLAPFIPPKCLVFRQRNPERTVLCLDFADCPQKLKMSPKKWSKITLLLANSCNELGLAKSLLFKNGKQILGWIGLKPIE